MEHPIIPFAPVARRPRHDGWTAARQIAFIEALAETGCVEEACKHVGMGHVSAYRLRRHPDGGLFRAAWDAALDYALHRLEQAAIGRALNGVPRPVFYRGQQVGEWRQFDERLAMFLLRYRRRARYGAWLDGPDAAAGTPVDDEDWEAERLSGLLAEIDDLADIIDDPGDDPGDDDGAADAARA